MRRLCLLLVLLVACQPVSETSAPPRQARVAASPPTAPPAPLGTPQVTANAAALVALTAPPQTNQGAHRWTPAGFGGGGNFLAIVPDPVQPGVVYALSDVSGVHRSADFGQTWQLRNTGLGNYEVSSLAVDPLNPDRLYAGVGGFAESDNAGIFVSDNAGLTWSPLPASATNGITFRYYRTAHSLLAHPTQAGLVLSGSKNAGIWRSTNAGASWTQVQAPPQTNVPLFHPFGHEAPDDPDASPFPAPVTTLLLDPTNPDILYAGWFGAGVMRSSDRGQTWQNRSNGLPPQAIIHNLALGQHGVLYAAAGPDGVFRSNDGGANWFAVNGNLPLADIRLLGVAVHPTDPNVVYVAEMEVDGANNYHQAVWRSNNGGQSWFETALPDLDLTANPTQVWAYDPLASWDVALDPYNPERLYFVEAWGIYRSDDGGQSWQTRVQGAQNTCVTDLLTEPLEEGVRLWATHWDDGLLRSDDAGISWQPILPARTGEREARAGHYWRIIRIVDDGQPRYFTTASPWNSNDQQVLRSSDGLNWEVVFSAPTPDGDITAGLFLLAADPAAPGTLYSATDSGPIRKTTDFGDTWTTTGAQPGSLRVRALVVAQDGTVYAGTFWEGLYRSRDGGNSWDRVFGDKFLVWDLAAAPDGAVYATAEDGNLYRTTNGGDSWQNLTNLPFDDDPDGSGSQGYAVGIDPTDPDHILFSRVDTWHLADNGDGVYESRDGGQRWQRVNDGLGVTRASSFAFVPDGTVFTGTACGGTWRLGNAAASHLLWLPLVLSTHQGGEALQFEKIRILY